MLATGGGGSLMLGGTTNSGRGGPVISSTSKTRYVLSSPRHQQQQLLLQSTAGGGGYAATATDEQQSAAGTLTIVSNERALTHVPSSLTNTPRGGGAAPPRPPQQGLGGTAAYSSSASTTPASSSSSLLLSRDALRTIGNTVTFNSKLPHTQRLRNAANTIPALTFATRLRGPCDSVTGLQVAPIDPQESALDVVLRLTSPEDLRAPALKDAKATTPLSSRLVALLKGTATSMPMHWDGEKDGVERDHAHVQALKDAKMRIEAAKRSEDPFNEGKARCCLAALHYNSSNMEGAIKTLAVAVPLFEDCRHVAGLAFVHNTLGVSYYKNGEFKMALVHFRKQEALCGAYGKAVARINMGVCYAALEEPAYALQAFTDAAESARGHGGGGGGGETKTAAAAAAGDEPEPVLETIAIGNRGLAFMRLGQMRAAQTELEACLEQCSVGGDHVGAVVCLLLLGQNAAACRDYSQAVFYYEHALRLAEQAKCVPLAAMAKVSVGVCRGQSTSKDLFMATAGSMGTALTVSDVVKTLSIKQ